MITPQTRDKILVLVGGSILVGIVLLSWIPSSCPVLRNVLIGCPNEPLSRQTPEDKEKNRIAHQAIRGTIADFKVKAEQNRTKTRVVFYYRTPETTKVTLKIKQGSTLIPLATVAHPILYSGWSRTVSSSPETVLLRSSETDERPLNEFLLNPGVKYFADISSVRLFSLSPGSFVPLESSTDATDVGAALLSHHPPTVDGTWKLYEQEIDMSGFEPEDEQLSFVLDIQREAANDEFLLGNVNIDFRK